MVWIRRGHFGRALEEAVQTHASQWPSPWNGKNPLHGGGNFAKMGPTERVSVLKLRRWDFMPKIDEGALAHPPKNAYHMVAGLL